MHFKLYRVSGHNSVVHKVMFTEFDSRKAVNGQLALQRGEQLTKPHHLK
jgi:hypothetical protein